MASFHEHIAAGRRALADAGFPAADAALDAEVLAREVLGWDRTRLVTHGGDPATPDFIERFDRAVERRLKREPVAFITGHREFWGLDFLVTPATLIPRPETELIVEEALSIVPSEHPATLLDIGTGSGCLAVSLARERPAARVVATDLSLEALLVARRNAILHGVSERVRFVRTDLMNALSVAADVIVSNPPYVPEDSAGGLPPDVVRYEPPTALFGGPDGLAVIRRLLADASLHLAPGGRFIVEFGFGQEHSVRELARRSGWTVVRVVNDLQGIARTIVLGR
jgi:release factor glutamine methyltransferase